MEEEDDQSDFEGLTLENIIKKRTKKVRCSFLYIDETKKNKVQYLVKWLELEDPIWEEEEFLQEEYTMQLRAFLKKKQETSKNKEESEEVSKRVQPQSSRFSKRKSTVIFALIMLQIGKRGYNCISKRRKRQRLGSVGDQSQFARILQNC
jgi:hypothetical protein